ncbi:hypothetical protein [Methanobacterium oryzae]|uniref:hypothetical protein n=1 Tax=Methanobacterium oryzae TaxID=69540 RepID=UPI003D1DD6B0
MYNLIEFFKEFYGESFIRDYRRISPIETRRFIVQSPKVLIRLLNGEYIYSNHYMSVNSREERNSTTSKAMDRLFMDFDTDDQCLKDIKNKIVDIQMKKPHNILQEEQELIHQYQDILIEDKVAETPINEAKRVAKLIYDTFGVYPILVFSGAKGCHLYIPYNPVLLNFPNKTIELICNDYTSRFNLTTLDPAPSRDANARISRIPYTRHPISGMYAVLFGIEDDYTTIMEKSVNPVVEPFKMQNHMTDFDKYLPEIDMHVSKMKELEKQQRDLQNYRRRLRNQRKCNRRVNIGIKGRYRVPDCRDLAQDILGVPEADYEDYITYKCPFHSDKHPSMSVYNENFFCGVSGCVGALNYWNFLKKYYNMADAEVRDYLIDNYPEN